MTVVESQVKHYVQNSLMLVTALNPHIGYDSTYHNRLFYRLYRTNYIANRGCYGRQRGS